MIGPEDDVDLFGALHPTWSFLAAEHAAGIGAADHWLTRNRDLIGERSSLDTALFHPTPAPLPAHLPAPRPA